MVDHAFQRILKVLVSAAEKYKINLSVVKSVIKSNQERVEFTHSKNS